MTRSPAAACTELAPGVRCLLAPNGGIMTGPGTNTYLLGVDDIAVVDPGPALQGHVDAIQAAAGGTIRWVLVTHTHPDHSPAASMLAAASGAELIGMPAPPGAHQDRSFRPQRVPQDGGVLDLGGLRLRAVHTPGHASNHVCYLLLEQNWLLTGDHIINGSTVVIDPPDGDMSAYLASLERLGSLRMDAILPGHGTPLDDPYAVIQWTIEHRLQREAKVHVALLASPGLSAAELVPHVYRDVDSRLHPIAERSLLAHLIKLQRDARAVCKDERWTACA